MIPKFHKDLPIYLNVVGINNMYSKIIPIIPYSNTSNEFKSLIVNVKDLSVIDQIGRNNHRLD